MSGDKSEKPTAKRLRDARKKGQVAKSNDLTQAFLFLTAAGVLYAGGGAYVSKLRMLMQEFFRPDMLTGALNQEQLLHRFGYAFAELLLLSAPLLGALFIVSAAANYMQVKTIFAPEIIKPKFDKLNIIKGFQNKFFKARTYLELLKSLVKFAVITFLVYKCVRGGLRDVILTARVSLLDAGRLAAQLMYHLLFQAGWAFVVIGAADYMLQQKQYMKGLMMSKDEVHREYKQDEGDPHIKHQRKHIHQEMLNEAAVHRVPKSTVVVVNPTHLAIALLYDEQTMAAPRIVAKGQNNAAQRIIALAKKHGRPIVRNVPLAHSLFALEIESDIPEELYEAVAEVLNWVYQLAAGECQSDGVNYADQL